MIYYNFKDLEYYKVSASPFRYFHIAVILKIALILSDHLLSIYRTAGWCISLLSNFLWLKSVVGFILDMVLFVFSFSFFFFSSISHAEMSVILHFIYGGILDFPDKVDVGYMSTHIIFNCSLCLFCIFSVKRKIRYK